MKPQIEERRDRKSELHLAAGWYMAMSSTALRSTPRVLQLFERRLVAWRDGDGRAVIMPDRCPHLGASLGLGGVVDGCLQCPFHHWRFAASGACVEIPGVDRIPPAASHAPYPVVERYGFVWVWYGGGTPMYAVPEVPALEADRGRYRAYRFTYRTSAPARRVLENAFDFYHFVTVHGVKSAQPPRLTMLRDPQAAAENGPAFGYEAWLGARLESRNLRLPRVARLLGIQGNELSLLVDGWPGGQRLTFMLDGHVVAKELLGITPVARNDTVFQGWSLVRRSGRWWDPFAYLVYRIEHWRGTLEDLGIYRNVEDPATGVPVKYDYSVLKFRKYYQTWVERAEQAVP